MRADHMDNTPTADALRPFDALLGITEDAFDVAGGALEHSIGQLQSLRGVFTSLETALGTEADITLKRQVADVADQAACLRAGIDRNGRATAALRGGMASIRSEVRDLNRVAQLVANISINARIQGNSLRHARPQITSFVERLGHLSAEADAILSQVNQAMASAQAAVADIETAQLALSDGLLQTTFPAIEAFTQSARAISEEQPALRGSSAMLAQQMQLVSSDVARLVTFLQIGDTLRQRLEQSHAALALAGPNPSDKALSYRLAAALAQGAMDDSLPPISDGLAALTTVAARGQDITRMATTSAFATGVLHRATTGEDHVNTFHSSLATTRAHFATMQAGAHRARAKIDTILGHDPALQQVAHNLRMAGINAVIACAKLGSEGRALRELAQWLRIITDACDSTMARLQIALGHSRKAIYSVSDDLIAQTDRDLSAFLDMAARLGISINEARRALTTAAGQFNTVTNGLSSRLGTASSALAQVQTQMAATGPRIQILQMLSSCFAPPDIATKDAQTYLAAIRGRYTMAAERDLHDQLCAQLATGGGIDPATAEPEPAARPCHARAPSDDGTLPADDDLADIMF
jgi:methyl-accepting chemotaxis protein